MGGSTSNMSSAKTFVDTKIQGKKVVMFSKTTCGFCARAKQVLQKYVGNELSGDDYEVVEINSNPDMSAIQDYLLSITGARSVPRVFINGKSLGGCDDTIAADQSGKLRELLTK